MVKAKSVLQSMHDVSCTRMHACPPCTQVRECKSIQEDIRVFYITLETEGLSGCCCFLKHSTSKTHSTQSSCDRGRVFPDVAAAVMALCKSAQPTDYPDGHMVRSAGPQAHIQTQTDSGLTTGFAK